MRLNAASAFPFLFLPFLYMRLPPPFARAGHTWTLYSFSPSEDKFIEI
jgi:hypothetical protein